MGVENKVVQTALCLETTILLPSVFSYDAPTRLPPPLSFSLYTPATETTLPYTVTSLLIPVKHSFIQPLLHQPQLAFPLFVIPSASSAVTSANSSIKRRPRSIQISPRQEAAAERAASKRPAEASIGSDDSSFFSGSPGSSRCP
jgi:hypothetical protein